MAHRISDSLYMTHYIHDSLNPRTLQHTLQHICVSQLDTKCTTCNHDTTIFRQFTTRHAICVTWLIVHTMQHALQHTLQHTLQLYHKAACYSMYEWHTLCHTYQRHAISVTWLIIHIMQRALQHSLQHALQLLMSQLATKCAIYTIMIQLTFDNGA